MVEGAGCRVFAATHWQQKEGAARPIWTVSALRRFEHVSADAPCHVTRDSGNGTALRNGRLCFSTATDINSPFREIKKRTIYAGPLPALAGYLFHSLFVFAPGTIAALTDFAKVPHESAWTVLSSSEPSKQAAMPRREHPPPPLPRPLIY